MNAYLYHSNVTAGDWRTSSKNFELRILQRNVIFKGPKLKLYFTDGWLDVTQYQTLGNFVINRCDIIMAIN